MRRAFLCLTIGAAVLGLGCGDDNGTGSTTEPPLRATIIYESDSSWADDFTPLLSDNGFTTELVELGDVLITDFSDIDLIIISSWIGSGYDFADSATVAIIKVSGKPILGVGPGGARLFEEIGVSINWGHCWVSSDTNGASLTCTHMYVVDPSHTVFTTPNSITIPTDSLLEIYTRSAFIGEYEPPLADSVTFIGREAVNETHYTLLKEGERFCLWCYANSPSSMTQTGKDLFVNVARHMAQ